VPEERRLVLTVISVAKPPASAFNPNRPLSDLIKAQIIHLQEAEKRLPVRRQTNVYINAIETEGEAADYIGKVTAALHAAHAKRIAHKRKTALSLTKTINAKTTERSKRRRNKKKRIHRRKQLK
jgi:hypothetical protein